jgi:hypothetical protein
VAFVSHGGFFNYFISVLFGVPEEVGHPDEDSKTPQGLPSGRWFLMNNAAITRIDFPEQEVRLAYQNRTDFLPRELIT